MFPNPGSQSSLSEQTAQRKTCIDLNSFKLSMHIPRRPKTSSKKVIPLSILIVCDNGRQPLLQFGKQEETQQVKGGLFVEGSKGFNHQLNP